MIFVCFDLSRHGNGQVFSCQGIQIAVDYFKDRGHEKITVFVPEWRKESSRPETPIIDQYLLEKLYQEKHLVYTPSRKLNGRRIVCYDDRFIVRLAHKEGGVIVSNDQFRDLMQENPEWKKVIEQRLLQFAFAADFFMPPDDPLGKLGPTLDQFLSKDPRDVEGGLKNHLSEGQGASSKPICPHLGNCTFGKKCQYYHPDREPQSSPLPPQQQPTQHQKVEQKVGSGLSAGRHTPTASSRSATPSPSPDSRTHGQGAHSTVKSNPRGHLSTHSSTDDHYHERRSFSGRAMNARALSDVVTPTSTSIDISELGKPSLHHRLPSRRLSGDGLKMARHQPTGWVVSPMHSPMQSEGEAPRMEQTHRQHNHTFPLAQLPHQEVLRENVTGDHSYLINQRALHVGQGLCDQASQQQCQHGHYKGGMADITTNTLSPRDACHSQRRPWSPSSASPYSQHHPPAQHHLSRPPLSSCHPQSPHDYSTNQSNLRQDRYQVSSSSQLPSSSSPLMNYGEMAANVYPSSHHANHVMMSSPSGYNTSYGGSGGSVGIDQSTVPFHNIHHPLPQPPPPLHTPYQHVQQGYVQATPTNLSHVVGQMHPINQVDYSGSRQGLYRAAVAVMSGCEQRVQYVLDKHKELSSERDIGTLLDLVRQMD